MLSALLAGLLTGLSLIVAIGAQNAFVLRTGLSRHHVGLVVALCISADAALIAAGTAGIGGLLHVAPAVLQILRWAGVAYLLYFAGTAARRALHPTSLRATEQSMPSRGKVAITTLALTFLNPHVYIDTVLLLGSLGAQYGARRWLFALGAALGSLAWFTVLGFGARWASPVMDRPRTWRVLESLIAVVMVLVAYKLAFTKVQ